MDRKKKNNMLDQAGKVYPFGVPDNYFDSVPSRIMSLIERENEPVRKRFFIRYLKPSLGLVASFLIIIGLLSIPAKLIFPGKMKAEKVSSGQLSFDEFVLTYPLSDQTIYEALKNGNNSDDSIDDEQLENVLMASVSEYDLINLN